MLLKLKIKKNKKNYEFLVINTFNLVGVTTAKASIEFGYNQIFWLEHSSPCQPTLLIIPLCHHISRGPLFKLVKYCLIKHIGNLHTISLTLQQTICQSQDDLFNCSVSQSHYTLPWIYIFYSLWNS